MQVKVILYDKYAFACVSVAIDVVWRGRESLLSARLAWVRVPDKSV
jgi:hypothetical protein